MVNLKKLTCMILAAAMILVSAPIEALAGEIDLVENIDMQEEISVSEEISDGEFVESELIEDEIGEGEITECEILADNLEEPEEELEEIVDYDLSADEMEAKKDLADNMYSFDNEVPGSDYVEGMVFAMVDSQEKAEEIADIYDITLNNYDGMIAEYGLQEGVSVADIINKAADTSNNYPAVYANHIGSIPQTSADETTYSEGDFDLASDIEAGLDEGYELSSLISDRIRSEWSDEPFLKESNSNYQWYIDAIGAPYAWAKYDFGAGEKIAILSSGVNLDSELMNDDNSFKISDNQCYNVLTQQSGAINCTDGSNEKNGTNIACAIGANMNGQCGIGVAPWAQLLNIKVYDSSELTEANLIKGINKAIEKDATIIVIDGYFDCPTTALESACNSAYKRCNENVKRGIAIFAGTKYRAEQSEVWPAAYKSVIGVGALNMGLLRHGMSGYSNAEFSAPGDGINATASYASLSGTNIAAAIAAGEAAVLLSDLNIINNMYDKNGVELCGEAFVEALRKVMKKGAVSTGSGTGNGMVFLPKALGLTTISSAPLTLTLEDKDYKPESDDYKWVVRLTTSYYDPCYVVYTTNGKNPTFKNGVAGKDCEVLEWSGKDVPTSENPFDQYMDIEPSLRSFPSVTGEVRVILVNSIGNCSNVATIKRPLDLYSLTLKWKDADPNAGAQINLAQGKKIQFFTEVIPSNSKTKGITWEVRKSGTHLAAEKYGVTISSSGVLSAKSNATEGIYIVKATSKINNGFYKEKQVRVVAASTDSVKVKKGFGNITLYRTSGDTLKSLSDYFECNDFSHFYFLSSKPEVADISSSNKVLLKQPGKAVITCYANDNSGKKASMTINVIQNATGMIAMGDDYAVGDMKYNKVAKGKSVPISYSLIPSDAKVKKITWSIINPNTGEPEKNIKISGGKIVTNKNTPIISTGYLVKATIYNYDPDSTPIEKSFKIYVVEEGVSSISLDKTDLNLFAAETAFCGPVSRTQATVCATITGGERKNPDGTPNLSAFLVTSSNPEFVSFEGLTDYYGGNIDDIGIKVKLNPLHLGTGKVTFTIKALDGTNKSAKFTVNVVNPVSSISVAPAKAGTNMAVMCGKTLVLKAIVGEEYGKVSTKKVKWSLTGGTDIDYATINPNTGVITAKKNAIPEDSTLLWHRATVKAESLDGSGAFYKTYVYIYKDLGKMEFCDGDGYTNKSIKNSKTVSLKNYNPNDDNNKIRIRLKNTTNALKNTEFVLSSSNSSIATIKYVGSEFKNADGKNYNVYTFVPVVNTTTKTGTAKLTIKTIDGSQSVTYTLKVTK